MFHNFDGLYVIENSNSSYDFSAEMSTCIFASEKLLQKAFSSLTLPLTFIIKQKVEYFKKHERYADTNIPNTTTEMRQKGDTKMRKKQ